MEFLLVINCLVSVFNTLLLVAIAGSVVKMVGYVSGEEELPTPSVERGLTDLSVTPNYDGVRSLPPNFDGVGGFIE